MTPWAAPSVGSAAHTVWGWWTRRPHWAPPTRLPAQGWGDASAGRDGVSWCFQEGGVAGVGLSSCASRSSDSHHLVLWTTEG